MLFTSITIGLKRLAGLPCAKHPRKAAYVNTYEQRFSSGKVRAGKSSDKNFEAKASVTTTKNNWDNVFFGDQETFHSVTELLSANKDLPAPVSASDKEHNNNQQNKVNVSELVTALKDDPHWRSFLQKLCDFKEQATRTVIVRIPQKADFNKFMSICSQVDELVSIDWLHNAGGQLQAVIEYKTVKPLQQLFKEINASAGTLLVNKNHRLLEFPTSTSVKHSDTRVWAEAKSNVSKLSIDTSFLLTEVEYCDKLDEVMLRISQQLELSSLQNKLNYLSCQLIDDALNNIFPLCCTLPHGSTINSLAMPGSDLDMVLHPFGLSHYNLNTQPDEKGSAGSCMFQPMQNNRIITDGLFEKDAIRYLAFVVRYLIANCSKILSIPNAKVPIIKFNEPIISTSCDLQVDRSINNSVIASYMIHRMCDIDPRVRPLLRSVKLWAMNCNVTTTETSNHLTNFSLIHMMIYFLQQVKILPPANSIYNIDNSVHDSKRCGSNETLSKEYHSKNTADIGNLYTEFFHFWSKFNYDHVIDIRTGTSYLPTQTATREFSKYPLKIVNTLEPARNIAKITSEEKLQYFIRKATSVKSINSKAKYLHTHLPAPN